MKNVPSTSHPNVKIDPYFAVHFRNIENFEQSLHGELTRFTENVSFL